MADPAQQLLLLRFFETLERSIECDQNPPPDMQDPEKKAEALRIIQEHKKNVLSHITGAG